jgi:uncharacterized RDD family membrane protein YckC
MAEHAFTGTLHLGAPTPPPQQATEAEARPSEPSSIPQVAIRGRLNAIMLDLVLLGMASRLLAGALGKSATAGTAILFFWALQFAYFFAFEVRTGQTIGKRAFHVRVATLTGGRPTWRQIAIRNVFRVFDALPLLYASGLLSLMRTGRARRQRIGDVVARTTVVLDREGKPLRTPAWLLPVATILATAISLAVVVPILSGRHASVPATSGFAGDTSEAPAEGRWVGFGTTTRSLGYSTILAGERIRRGWTISRGCASAGRCPLQIVLQLQGRPPAVAALVPRSDGWHAEFPLRTFSCGFTATGQTIYWQQHSTMILRFANSGRSAEAHERDFSETPACGYGTATRVWTAELLPGAVGPG